MTDKLIHIYKDKKELAEEFAQMLVAGTLELPHDSYFSIALSGGSTPAVIFRHLASEAGKDINWSKIRIFWGDERCVGPNHDDSNYAMAKENLFNAIDIPATNIFRIKGENHPATEAKNYASLVKKMLPAQDGIPRFDLFMLGLGDDGHTASIFPDNISGFYSEKLFIVATNPNNQQIRVSATGTLINQARKVVFLVTGAAKAERLAQILKQKPGWEKLPASLVQPVDGTLCWLLDQASAQLLKNEAPT